MILEKDSFKVELSSFEGRAAIDFWHYTPEGVEHLSINADMSEREIERRHDSIIKHITTGKKMVGELNFKY